jgi:uncharacterized protein YcfJ
MLGLLIAVICQANVQAESSSVAYASFAEVIDSKPIYAQRSVSTPVKKCVWEPLPAIEHYHRGGLERRVTERRAKRCRYETTTSPRRFVTGYEVTLLYHGSVFTRFTSKKPSKRMPITVEVALLD